MNIDLRGKSVLVTGAGAGIGQAIALAFAQAGARVAVNDLRGEGCEETLAMLANCPGAQAMAAPFDVADLDAARAGVAGVEQRFGRVDVLVNNAAVMLGNLPFVETRPEDCEREIRVGLFGALHCSRAVLPGMLARGEGALVNIVSDAARVGQEKEVAYSSAKGGVIAFTKSLAREVGRQGVRVNAVSPAATDTPLRRAMLARLAEARGEAAVQEREAKVRRAYPLRRIGRCEDVAALALFLASPLAAHVTGQIVSVNGGYAMPG